MYHGVSLKTNRTAAECSQYRTTVGNIAEENAVLVDILESAGAVVRPMKFHQ